MSQPQEPHRPFFPFGNPFRIISPKGSNLSPRLLSIVNTFEETLAESLRKLNPKDKNDVLSLSWMKMAMESLCATHNDIKALITDLKLPVIDWDEKWIDVYLDISVKLLDICNAFSSELTRLNQGHLLLQCFMHNLESNTSNQFVKARSTLNSWRQHIRSKNVRIESCRPILDDLVESLDLPKVKNSAKGKVLMRAMYGVKVKTVFICSVYTAAFAGSSKNLIDLNVPSTVSWAQAYSDLQTSVNGEIREIFSSGRFTALKELEAVETNVKKLYPMIENGLGTVKLLAESFAESMFLPGGYVSLLRFLVKQYLIERRSVMPHAVTLIGFYKGSEEDEDELAGTVEVCFDKRGANASPPSPTPPKNSAYICNMTVKEPLRRKGIGWNLLKAGEELICKMTENREVYLHCRMIDSAPFNMYTKAGYKVVQTDSVLVLLMLQRRKHLMCKILPLPSGSPEKDVSGYDAEIPTAVDS